MNISFTPTAFDDLRYWMRHDRKTADRIMALIEEIKRNPFTGSGKPEPLKFQLAGCWSRRVSVEHRLVYLVKDGEIVVLACRHHYR